MTLQETLLMMLTKVMTRLLWAVGYPSFAPVKGPYEVGALQARFPDSVTCQVHYPAANGQKGGPGSYWRPQAVEGLADYSRTSASLLQYLSTKQHPCRINAEPMKNKKFPLVLFSHGLGGSMEMYTQLCQQIASQGYLVVALEHEDGSGAYAETSLGKPIFYKRPDDTPYSRQKVVNFRRPFLEQRVQEMTQVLDIVLNKPEATSPQLQKVLKTCDTSQGVSMVGHSFGGAGMILAAQKYQQEKIFTLKSLCLMDVWAFSLDDKTLNQGVPLPTLHVLSEGWLTNSEKAQVDQFLQNCPDLKGSYYVPNCVHASFSDAVSWLPRVMGRKLWLVGKKEKKHSTIPATAQACVQNIQSALKGSKDITIANDLLKDYDYGKPKKERVAAAN